MKLRQHTFLFAISMAALSFYSCGGSNGAVVGRWSQVATHVTAFSGDSATFDTIQHIHKDTAVMNLYSDGKYSDYTSAGMTDSGTYEYTKDAIIFHNPSQPAAPITMQIEKLDAHTLIVNWNTDETSARMTQARLIYTK